MHLLTYLKDAMLDMKTVPEFNNTHNLLHVPILQFVTRFLIILISGFLDKECMFTIRDSIRLAL